ncbi:hypothetical protein MMC32_003645 [Xylographa parallela]|nr:hypothetical protein [Xylographa parallela]
MALLLSKAATLRPEIRLAQAMSEYEAILLDDQKAKLRIYRGQSPPTVTDVVRLTREIDQDISSSRKSRRCVGPRLTNILQAVQQFSSVVDVVIGGSQSQVASTIWGVVKLSLQVTCAFSSYFDRLSTLYMMIGRTCPRFQDFGLLYSRSTRLQDVLCEYFIVVVKLSKQNILFLRRNVLSQLASSLIKIFDSEFGTFRSDLENIAAAVRDEVSLISKQMQDSEMKESSMFRTLITKFSDTESQDQLEARSWRRQKDELQFLDACSTYEYQKSWKQARKRGYAGWIFENDTYNQWKQEPVSSTIWCNGILGSGKTVLSANVIEDLMLAFPAAVVAYFFCRHDEVESLETRTIIGSIVRQILEGVKPNMADTIENYRGGKLDADQLLIYLENLLPIGQQRYFIVIDGIDECSETTIRALLKHIQFLLVSKHVFRIYLACRPDVLRWAPTLLQPHRNGTSQLRRVVTMSEASHEIATYIENTLAERLASEDLCLGDPTLILTIRDTLSENTHGMFLWVAFQIESICAEKTDQGILDALKELPKDLPETFNRILRKLQCSKVGDVRLASSIFQIVAAAQRPLDIQELREALAVKIGETAWDPKRLINDMLRSLDCCGSLLVVDEEYSTVHFTHYSVKQHLSKPTASDIQAYFFSTIKADSYLGCICITYLNLDIFGTKLVSTRVEPQSAAVDFPAAIVSGMLPQLISTNQLALRFLKSKRDYQLDLGRQLQEATVVGHNFQKEKEQEHPFLPYAKLYWLFHTKSNNLTDRRINELWDRIFDGEVKMILLPWASYHYTVELQNLLNWLQQHGHHLVINSTVSNLPRIPKDTDGSHPKRRDSRILNLLNQVVSLRDTIEFPAEVLAIALNEAFEFSDGALVKDLLEMGAGVNEHSLPYAVFLDENREVVVRMLLNMEGLIDINAKPWDFSHGTALEAACSNEAPKSKQIDIVRLLLAKGANVNEYSRGLYGSPLMAAISSGNIALVQLLLRKGANVKIQGGLYGTALQGALVAVPPKCLRSKSREWEMLLLLLDHGADIKSRTVVSLKGFETSLQAAAFTGNHELVNFVLSSGADVNEQYGVFGTALKVAAYYGHMEIVQFLLQKGADPHANEGKYGTAMGAAQAGGHEEIVQLFRRSMKQWW